MTLMVARPSLILNGQDSVLFRENLLELRIEDSLEGLCRLEATFSNWGNRQGQLGFLFRKQDVYFQTLVQVKLQDTVLFEGRVSALEAGFPEGAGPELTFLAEDALKDLRVQKKTRTFEHMSITDVVQQIARQNGLQAQVDAATDTRPLIMQLEQTDLGFLRDLALQTGAEIMFSAGKLYFQTRDRRSPQTLTLKVGTNVRDLTITADLANQVTGVEVHGWDVTGKQGVKESAGDSALGAELQADSAASILQALGLNRVKSLALPIQINATTARTQAQAEYRRVARSFVTLHGVTDPDPKLKVGNKIDLQAAGEGFSGTYSVTSTCFRFDSLYGARFEFTAQRPDFGGGF
ncbi:phage late control D family protein [Deinococcus cellulosilyticus]|uniref:Phage late control D family protein n=1 Tax=Deinococcus cellulosilyticus (strain DSM 18568 / NBRC 106333 / KACC 11606 / 5516J-15) TaxID=1223518 RepID=A0A511MZG9_DEIC1|nr:contractile injection system protein, VgrG/Pvc8 family [Deinococcus cellulosilyticus]GEM46015.1 hypothetical protein DC3_16500 [Deinococcus cellulosilyticus NBRC 106333 = KACC 11606]